MIQPDIDRAACQRMVEDFYRVMLGADTPEAAQASIARFMEHVRAIAQTLPEAQQGLFLDAIEQERETIFREYERDPRALKRRLGIRQPETKSAPAPRSNRQGLGETAVKTAIRATIWQGIRELFRVIR